MRSLTIILGGGGARGLCFIGALRALDANGIHVSNVIATSMGAIVGGAYCSGVSTEEIEKRARSLRLRHFVRVGIPRRAVFSHEGVEEVVRRFVSVESFENHRPPLTIVCTDVQTGGAIYFDSGTLIPPLVGSCLAAGIFEPVGLGERLLIDGGYTDPLPVRMAPAEHVVLAIDPCVKPDWRLPMIGRPRFWGILNVKLMYLQVLKAHDVMLYRIARDGLLGGDHIHVAPRMDGVTFVDFREADRVIHAGEVAVLESLPKIRRALEE